MAYLLSLGSTGVTGPRVPSLNLCVALRAYGLPGQQLTLPVWFVPDHQHAELHWVRLAVTFGFARERVPHDRGMADDLDGLIREGDELPRRSSTRGGVDKLRFVLHPARRMAVAELIRCEGLELAPIS